jgi:Yip1-like protein
MTTFSDDPPPPPPPHPDDAAPPVIVPSPWSAPAQDAAGGDVYGAAPFAPAPAAPGERLSPWASIFTRPRATMRQILDEDPRRLVHVLAMLGGIAEMIGAHLPDVPPFFTPTLAQLVAVKVACGAIGGLAALYLYGATVWLTGRMLGGRGTFVDVRAATAWSNVPALWGALLWLPFLAYLGTGALNLDPETLLGDPAGLALLVPIGLAGAALFFWRLVIYCKCLGEAHRFSAWHGFGSALIAIVLLAVPIAIMALVVVAVGGLTALGATS